MQYDYHVKEWRMLRMRAFLFASMFEQLRHFVQVVPNS
jgi:hypothetical protein